MQDITIKPIGVVHTKFPEKFGIPRQSGIVETPGYIKLVPPYNDSNAVRGLEEFSYIWLIWQVSGALDRLYEFSPTVRPPRLGGNTRVGVFATRSPFHPNAMGLSCVKLERIEYDSDGPVIYISGADILDGTPIYDIKPYVVSGDLRPDAACGFVDRIDDDTLEVIVLNEEAVKGIDVSDIESIKELIACDPRPRYQDDPDRIYHLRYGSFEISFKVEGRIAKIIDNIEYR